MNDPRSVPKKRIQALAERRLGLEELNAWVDAPMTDEERERILELVRWFKHRYPTALERFRYIDRAYVRWTQRAG